MNIIGLTFKLLYRQVSANSGIQYHVLSQMDEEFNEEQRDSRHRDSNNYEQRRSIMSLDRMSGISREPSLRNRPTLVQVLSLDGSEMGEDILEYYEFQTTNNRRSFFRNSGNSRMGSGNENSMDIEQSRDNRRSSNANRGPRHDCQCDEGNCLQYHCNCSNDPNDMCLLGYCCFNCIKLKNQMMAASEVPVRNRLIAKKETTDPSPIKKILNKPKPLPNKNSKTSTIGCSCKKSHCLKKYCCCYSSGKQCGPQCVCEQCHNQYEADEDKEEKDYERQRYGRVDEHQEEDIDQYFQEKNYDDDQMPPNMEFEHPDMKLSYQH